MSFTGKLLYRTWYWPRAQLSAIAAAGGPLEVWRTTSGRRAMADRARRLPLLPQSEGRAIELHLLSGRRFWDQTVFCLWTFARQSGRPLAPIIYDDGTLGPRHLEPLARLFSNVRFVSQQEVIARLDRSLPAKKFPALRERWAHYPNIRKLIDPHVGEEGWKLVIDSDLLFFRRPDFLLHWVDHPECPLHAVDCETAYGYSDILLRELAGHPLAERVNVGLTGLNSSEIDWERLERWTRLMIEREGTHYLMEQALIAALVAGRRCAIAPAADYVTRPVLPEAHVCRAVMHHYVADSKPWYFRQNWRRAEG